MRPHEIKFALQEKAARMTDRTRTSPAAREKLNPYLKLALELGPLALFFITYKIWDYLPATAVLMASVAIALGISYRIVGRIPTMPFVTAVIVGIFGGLTLLFQDKTLLQIKPTALYLLFGAALFAGLALKRNLLAVLFDGAFHLSLEGWRKLTWRWAFFFLALAALNELIRQYYSFDAWVKFKTFGFLPLTFVFALAQAPLIIKYDAGGTDDEQEL
jgi:intracellular septation protein